MTSTPTAEEHRDWFAALLPFASGGTSMLILRQPDGDSDKVEDYISISDLNEDGVTVASGIADGSERFFFSWSESAAMELDIGRFLTGQISRQELDAKHPRAWVGLSLAYAAEQELMRRERSR